jgi:GTP-binding protein
MTIEPEQAPAIRPATVAIVGRPNVGKSALFNRLIGRRLAIVDDMPGVTRDRMYALADWRGRTFTLVDTAGIDPDGDDGDAIAVATRAQAKLAAEEADLLLFVVDAAAGLSPLDDDVVMILRRTKRPVIIVANKAESPRALAAIAGEFSRLGLGEPIAVSAIHGEGTGDLLDAIVERLPPEGDAIAGEGELALAIVGRPNVGKSSLLNAVLGEERVVVSDVAGTTRDAIDTFFDYRGKRVRLIDTAGMRKKPQSHGSIEYYASLRSLSAIARCDIAMLVIDSMEGIHAQDRRLAGLILEERKGLIIVGNKWDLVREQGEYQQADLVEAIYGDLPFARFAPVTFLSAQTKRKLGSLMPLALQVAENLDRRISTHQLNGIIRDAVYAHPAATPGGKPLRIYYTTQVATHPPLFAFYCNDPDLVHVSYKRFLENVLREHADFSGVPIGMDFRARRSEDAE